MRDTFEKQQRLGDEEMWMRKGRKVGSEVRGWGQVLEDLRGIVRILVFTLKMANF